MHLSDKDYFVDFIEKIPVNEWKQKTDDEFKQRIDELTEDFKGRIEERNFINNFINKAEKGFMMVYGNPGIGKSALLAQITKEIKQIPQKSRPIIIDYFIRRGTSYASPERMLDHLNDSIERYYNTKMPRGNNADEKLQYLISRFNKINQTAEARHLIIIIDGLDEGIEEDRNIIKFIPTEITEKISFILGSRQISEAEQFYDKLPPLNRNKLLLGGLKKEDVRALLYDIVSKYALEEQFVENIVARSEGNPLYIRMLCLALEEGDMKLNDSKHLPAKLNDFYKEFIAKYSKHSNGNILLKSLYVFAASKDFITTKQLQFILNIGEADAEMVIYEMREVLFDNPVTEEEDFQLFHESFREYLIKEKNSSVREAELNIIRYCRQWNDLLIIDPKLALYPFKYYSFHLMNLGVKDELMELAFNQKFIIKQFDYTSNRENSFNIYKHAALIIETSRIDISLKIYLESLWFHKQSSLNKEMLKRISNNTNAVYLSSLLNGFLAKGKMELSSILLYVWLNELIISDNPKLDLLNVIEIYLKENELDFVSIQASFLALCPKILADRLSLKIEEFKVFTMSERLLKVSLPDKKSEIVVGKKITFETYLYFLWYAPSIAEFFEPIRQKIKVGNNLDEKVDVVVFPFYYKISTFVIIFLGYIIQIFAWVIIWIKLLFKKEFRRSRNKLVYIHNTIIVPALRLGDILNRNYFYLQEWINITNSLFYSKIKNYKKFLNYLNLTKTKNYKAELMIDFVVNNHNVNKVIANNQIDEATKIIISHFSKEKKKHLNSLNLFHYDEKTIYQSGLERSIGYLGKQLASEDFDLFNRFYKSIRSEIINYEMVNKKANVFYNFIEGLTINSNINSIVDQIFEYCHFEKYDDSFINLLVLNEFRTKDEDYGLTKKVKKSWLQITDNEWKLCYIGLSSGSGSLKLPRSGTGKYAQNIPWEILSYEYKDILNEENANSIILDFYIENRIFLKGLPNGDIVSFFHELAGIGDYDEMDSIKKLSSLEKLKLAYKGFINNDKFTWENDSNLKIEWEQQQEDFIKVCARNIKTTVEQAKILEKGTADFFSMRDFLNNIPPAVYWDYMIQCEGEKFEFYLYFFQKFLVKHNALEEYFPKILPYIINDKDALLKMGYRLAYHATQKNVNEAFNKIQFNERLNQIMDLSIILND
jgi:hypothetical protein